MLRFSSLAMPVLFGMALIVSLIRVGASATHQFFIEKPHLKTGQASLGPKLEWLSPDGDANWVVRYRNSAGDAWEEATGNVAGHVGDEELRVRRLYSVTLKRLTPGDHFELEVFRNGEKAFSQAGPAVYSESRQRADL